MRYLKGTKDIGIFYRKEVLHDYKLHFYVDSSWSDYLQTRNSITGILAFVGIHFVDWSSKIQVIITHSTAESYYVAAESATRMTVWFLSLLGSLNEKQTEPTVMHEENQECTSLAKVEGTFLRSKHIGLHYHYLREKIENNEIILVHVPTEDQLADLLTKPLAAKRFEYLMKQVVSDSVMESYKYVMVCLCEGLFIFH